MDFSVCNSSERELIVFNVRKEYSKQVNMEIMHDDQNGFWEISKLLEFVRNTNFSSNPVLCCEFLHYPLII